MPLSIGIDRDELRPERGSVTIGLLIRGAGALVAFVRIELRVAEPLVDVRLFRRRAVWTSHTVAFAFGFAMFGTFILIPTLL